MSAHNAEKAQVATIAAALRDQMSLGTSGRWIVDFGTTPEHLAEDVWNALNPPAAKPDGVLLYLDTLESTNPSKRVQEVID